jgi:transcriptional regulator with PAS, ATPase and Fis domain
VSVDVRLIVAAKRPLDEQVEAGTFSLDLYQRLSGLTVQLPALRARKLDIPFIFMSALSSTERKSEPVAPVQANDVEPALVEQLCLYEWPGNLRELVTLAANYRRLWDRSGLPGYRFRKDDLPYQFFSGRPISAGRDRDRRDAAQLAALIEALCAMTGSRLRQGGPLQRSDVNFELACERAGVQRSLGYRQFKKWEALAAKGLVAPPSSDVERTLYRWYVEGKKE